MNDPMPGYQDVTFGKNADVGTMYFTIIEKEIHGTFLSKALIVGMCYRQVGRYNYT